LVVTFVLTGFKVVPEPVDIVEKLLLLEGALVFDVAVESEFAALDEVLIAFELTLVVAVPLVELLPFDNGDCVGAFVTMFPFCPLPFALGDGLQLEFIVIFK
jgi:hypothetical protein